MIFNITEYKGKIDRFYDLMDKNKDIADVRISDDKWTLKEMVGHLIDSASNNHQRIIRLQIEDRIIFPIYDQDKWKEVTRIEGYDFVALINLWKGYNYFLLHLIQNIEEKDLNNIWEITGGGLHGQEWTLKFIIEDYFEEHMDWHFDLYKNRIEEIKNE